MDDIPGQAGRETDADDFPVLLRLAADDRGGAIDVALDKVAAEPVFKADRPLEVDLGAGDDVLETGPAEGLPP